MAYFTGCKSVTYDNGDTYIGYFVDGDREGEGVYTWTDGSRYGGNWHLNKRHGKGTMQFSNGATYEGEWRNGERYGVGTYISPTGVKYQGDWKNNKREGHGISENSRGDIYKGEWWNDEYHGKGIIFYKGGDSFEGTFSFGEKREGTYRWESGAKLTSTFYNNKTCGVGEYVSPNGNREYGMWDNDVKVRSLTYSEYLDIKNYKPQTPPVSTKVTRNPLKDTLAKAVIYGGPGIASGLISFAASAFNCPIDMSKVKAAVHYGDIQDCAWNYYKRHNDFMNALEILITGNRRY